MEFYEGVQIDMYDQSATHSALNWDCPGNSRMVLHGFQPRERAGAAARNWVISLQTQQLPWTPETVAEH